MSEVVQEAKTLYDAFEVIYPSREDANSPYQILVPPEVYSGSMRFYHLSPELRICLLQKTNTINSKHGFILIFFFPLNINFTAASENPPAWACSDTCPASSPPSSPRKGASPDVLHEACQAP